MDRPAECRCADLGAAIPCRHAVAEKKLFGNQVLQAVFQSNILGHDDYTGRILAQLMCFVEDMGQVYQPNDVASYGKKRSRDSSCLKVRFEVIVFPVNVEEPEGVKRSQGGWFGRHSRKFMHSPG